MAKRLLDICVALAGLVLLAPILLGLAALVRWHLGPPVFFHQTRPGLHGVPFCMVKLRTMHECRDRRGDPLPDQDRLSPFGRWLRTTSLDELPELWNVLNGDMSLVGPRPLLMEYLAHYTPEQARRHAVRPGITGWAQVNGRNGLSWEERFRLDVWYVDNRSFRLDCKIMFLTLLALARPGNVTARGHVTMHRFDRRR